MKKVDNFLNMFHLSVNIDDVFATKCSYWFAFILFTRFIRDGATIMCDISKAHFGTRINDKIYDITGDVTSSYQWCTWESIDDDEIRSNIVNNHILF